MARLARYDLPDVPQHVIQRGNNRCVTFAADEDYGFYLDCLSESARKFGCDIHAYVLMTNHAHLLATPRVAGGVSKMMQSIGRRYVRYFNHAYKRTGTLWEGRYKATLIDSEQYLLACSRYIELNPLRAEMVAAPGDYPWSSFAAHALGKSSGVLSFHPLYLQLGATPRERQGAYLALFEQALGNEMLESIRDATNKSWVLGGERFKEEIADLSGRRVAPAPRGRPRREASINGL
ncbi:MAG: transposase [Rhodospirillales bacterium]|jgi:putative transposase|nr:transposase [Rhodospirillales bacterium]